jgi:hypothetical protein
MPGLSIASGAGAAGDLFGGIASGLGDFAEAGAYKTAAKYARANANIAQSAGDIKLEQTKRAIYKTIGAQDAGYASAGLTGSGSAQSVLRDSISQGSLEKSIVREQTAINVHGYEAEAAQFASMASAAKMGGIGSIIGGAASAAMMFSDRRLKTDIEKVDTYGKINIVHFRFHGDDKLRTGVLADEVARHAPYALGPVVSGYATVDYAKLGLAHLVSVEG